MLVIGVKSETSEKKTHVSCIKHGNQCLRPGATKGVMAQFKAKSLSTVSHWYRVSHVWTCFDLLVSYLPCGLQEAELTVWDVFLAA